MPRKRVNLFNLSPWFEDFILNSNKKQTIKAKVIQVLGPCEGLEEDGCEVKMITDGTLWMKGVFTSEAIDRLKEKFEDDSLPDWNRSRLLIRQYSARCSVIQTASQTRERCDFHLRIDECELMELEHGFHSKNKFNHILEIPAIWELANKIGRDHRTRDEESHEFSGYPDDDSNIPISQLIDMLDEQSGTDEGRDGDGSETEDSADEIPPPVLFDINEFLIPPDMAKKLAAIPEWKDSDDQVDAEDAESQQMEYVEIHNVPSRENDSDSFNKDRERNKASAKHPAKSSKPAKDNAQQQTSNSSDPAQKDVRDFGVQVGTSTFTLVTTGTMTDEEPVATGKGPSTETERSSPVDSPAGGGDDPMSQDAQRIDLPGTPDRLVIDLDSQPVASGTSLTHSTQADYMTESVAKAMELSFSPIKTSSQEDRDTSHARPTRRKTRSSGGAIDAEEERLNQLQSTSMPGKELRKKAREINTTPVLVLSSQDEREMERLESLTAVEKPAVSSSSAEASVVRESEEVPETSEEDPDATRIEINPTSEPQNASVLPDNADENTNSNANSVDSNDASAKSTQRKRRVSSASSAAEDGVPKKRKKEASKPKGDPSVLFKKKPKHDKRGKKKLYTDAILDPGDNDELVTEAASLVEDSRPVDGANGEALDDSIHQVGTTWHSSRSRTRHESVQNGTSEHGRNTSKRKLTTNSKRRKADDKSGPSTTRDEPGRSRIGTGPSSGPGHSSDTASPHISPPLQQSLTSYQPRRADREEEHRDTPPTQAQKHIVNISIIEDLLDKEAKKYGCNRNNRKNFGITPAVLQNSFSFIKGRKP